MARDLWSFVDLADAVAAQSLGVLVGWRRAARPQSLRERSRQASGPLGRAAPSALLASSLRERSVGRKPRDAEREGGHPVINPPNKVKKLGWAEGDVLLVVRTRERAM